MRKPLTSRVRFVRGSLKVLGILPMKIKINGDERDIADQTTIRALVALFNLLPEKVAIELNRRLVRAEKYDQTLNPGDEVEIVTFVGGG
jgi:thiamine biosynthesis protein ThiS